MLVLVAGISLNKWRNAPTIVAVASDNRAVESAPRQQCMDWLAYLQTSARSRKAGSASLSLLQLSQLLPEVGWWVNGGGVYSALDFQATSI